jgi:hypothetical protein
VLLMLRFALGLNVVVGWAGLLDLGFVAFTASRQRTTLLDSRTTACTCRPT